MLTRYVNLKDANKTRAKADGDLIIDMAFSSELPYERWWGIEILDHSESSVDLDRLNDGASLLFNHNGDDLRGAHEPGSVRIDEDRILRGKVRVTSATQTGRDTIALVESGVLSKGSIGYSIRKVIEQSTQKGKTVERVLDGSLFERVLTRCNETDRGDVAAFRRALDQAAGPFARAADEPTVYRVVSWEPFENSLVTIPADPTVGIGRNRDHSRNQPAKTAEHQEAEMAKGKNATAGDDADIDNDTSGQDSTAITGGEPNGGDGRGKKTPNALEMEQARIRAINNLCKANKIDEPVRDAWVTRGASLEQVSDDIIKILEERGKSNPQPASRIGLTRQEIQTFSLTRAIAATAGKDWSKAPFELECSQEISKRLNRTPDPNKFFVPFEVLERPVQHKRDLTVATAGAGGYLVETENQGFIEMLRNRSVAFRMGARRLSGLQGSVTVPRQSAAATAYWLSTEATQITESQQTFVQMALNPKNVGAYTEISRQLLLQSSPAAEGIVSDDLAQQVALAVDLAALEGSGASGQPTGISQTGGIGSVTGTSLAAAGVLEFMSDVATANVTPMRPGYVTTPAVAALLMVRPELPSTGTTRLWTGNMWDGAMFGIPAMSSNQPTAATMIFGDWQELVVAEWGVLEVEVNPYANFQAGIVGVRALYSMDIGVRRPFAFSRATSIT